MNTVLFWLAIPLGFFALPVGSLGFLLLPFALVSLFNQFAAPRVVLLKLFAVVIVSSLPPVMRFCQRVWLLLDPSEGNPKHAAMLGSQMLSSGWTVAYLSSDGWLAPEKTSWLLTAYWFICLTQLWSGFFMLVANFFMRRRSSQLLSEGDNLSSTYMETVMRRKRERDNGDLIK